MVRAEGETADVRLRWVTVWISFAALRPESVVQRNRPMEDYCFGGLKIAL
jgi:hypothetical protein